MGHLLLILCLHAIFILVSVFEILSVAGLKYVHPNNHTGGKIL